MWTKYSAIVAAVIILFASSTPIQAQDSRDRTIEQYLCRDVMRDSGANREVAIAFLHGFLLGRSGRTQFNLDDLHKQTEAFIEDCLSNPNEKAVEAMTRVKK